MCSGDPTVCTENSATLVLAGCLLEAKGIDHNILHLEDQSCKGDWNDTTHMKTFYMDSTTTCGMDSEVGAKCLGIFKEGNLSLNIMFILLGLYLAWHMQIDTNCLMSCVALC